MALASGNAGVATVSPDSLVFTADDWNQTQQVTVTGVDDDLDNDGRSTAISHTASGGGYGNVAGSVTVDLTDDDEVGLALSKNAVTVTEATAGRTATYTVSLAAQPTDTVRVALASGNVGVAAVSPDSLVFTADDWSQTQQVTVTGVDDLVDNDGRTTNISHTASGGGYGNVAGSVAVNLTDDDEAGLALSQNSVTVTEAAGVGRAATYTVALASQPTDTVRVALASGNVGVAAVSPDSLVFTADDWSQTQQVTVTGVDDAIDNDGRSTTISHTASGGGYVGETAAITVTLDDDDETGIVVPETIVPVTEGLTATYEVELSSEPTGTVTVILTSGDTAVATVSSDSLVFTAGDWDQARQVTVTGVDDDLDNDGRGTAVSHSASGGGYDGETAEVAVSLDDDEDDPTVTMALSSSTIDESGGTSTVTAVLDHPSATVTTVTVAVAPDQGAAQEDVELSANVTLTIAAGDTASTGTVVIASVDNLVDLPDKTFTVSGSAANAGGISGPDNLTLTVTDDDTKGMIVSETILSLTEGATGSYTLELASEPTGSVIVALTSTDEGVATVSSDSLVFTPESWNQAQTVAVTGVDDAIDNDLASRSAVVSNEASGGGYGGERAEVAVSLADDDDDPTVTLSLVPAAVAESGGVSRVVATLDHASAEVTTVTVSLVPNEGASASDVELSANATLTIAAGETASSGTVTITAVDNSVDAPDKTFTVSGTAVNAEGIVDPASVPLTVVDDDGRGVRPSTLGLVMFEGDTATYAVGLATQPTGAVAISVSSDDATVATVSPASLAFTASNWNSPQTVTVVANDDDLDNDGRAAVVSHVASGADYDGETTQVTISIVDDELEPTVTLALSPATISENGGVSTVTAMIDQASAEVTTVTVSVAPNEGASARGVELSANATLTIAAGDTASTGVVEITAVDDDVYGSDKTFTVSGSAENSDGVIDPSDLTLTVTDDDGSGLFVSETSLTVDEGGTAAYAVELLSQPAGDVTVTVTSGDAGVATVSPSSLVFTTEDWDQAQSVTVTAADDDIDNDGRGTVVSHSASGGGFDGETAEVAVSVEDDEADPTVTMTVQPATIAEDGGVAAVTAALDHASAAATTVTVTVAPNEGVSADGVGLSANATLTIAAGDTVSTGTVEIVAVDDRMDTPDKTYTVSGSAANVGGIARIVDATLTVADDDGSGLLVSETSLTVDEGGTAAYAVELLSQPAGDVTVTVTSGDAGVATVSPSSLVFTTEDWDQAQSVTVTAADDDIDNDGRGTVVSHSASGGGFDGETAEVAVSVEDDEADPTVTMTVQPATIAEDGGVAAVTAALDHASAAATTVTVTVAPNEGVSADGVGLSANATLTIAAGDTVSTGTVEIVAVDDRMDTPDKTYTVSGSAANVGGIARIVDATLTVADDDGSGLLVSETSLTVDEGGTAAYAVELLSQPAGDVTVTVTSGDAGVATVSPSSLVFTTEDWDQAQSVTVTAADDDIDNDGRGTVVTHSASGGGLDDETAEVTVSVEDDEADPTVALVLSPTTISEDGGVSSVTATLDHASADVTTVTVTVAPNEDASAGDVELSANATLTIAAGATASTGEVTITAVDNSTDEPDKTYTVSATAANDGGISGPAVQMLTVADDDDSGLLVSETSLTVDEGGTAAYAVELLSQPAGDVTVTVTSGDAGVATVSPSSLVFTTEDWDQAQSVTVTAADDDIDNDGRGTVVTHSASGGGLDDETAEVTVSVEDDEADPTVALVLSPTTISEDGGVSSVTATLDHASADVTTVTVTVAPNEDASAGDVELSANATLTIAAGATASTGEVTITAVDNSAYEPDKTFTVSGSTANDGGIAGIVDVTLTVAGDDDRTISISETSLSISEGGTASYTMALASRPIGEVTITVASGDVGVASVSPSPLVFTTSDWDQPQTVTVTVADDDIDNDGRSTVIAHTASGGGYSGWSGDVAVSVEDDEEDPEVTLTLSPATISENGGTSYVTVSLDHASADATMVTVSVTPNEGASASDVRLSLNARLQIAPGDTASSWVVTIAAVDNSVEEVDKTFTVSGVAVNAGGVRGPADLTLTVAEDDGRGMALSSSGLSVDEGGTALYTVWLTSEPVGEVNVEVASGDEDVATVSPAVLTFATSDWARPQVVTVTGTDDDVDNDGRATVVSHAASGGGYDGVVGPTLEVALLDDEQAALSVHPASSAEGSDLVFAATLNPAKSSTVTVDWTTEDGTALAVADYVAASGTLSFAPGDTMATFRVALIDDDLPETEEYLRVVLSNPADVALRTATAEGTILDDDAAAARGKALRGLLAGVGRTLASDAVAAVAGRMESAARSSCRPVLPDAGSVASSLKRGMTSMVARERHAASGETATATTSADVWGRLQSVLPREYETRIGATQANGVCSGGLGLWGRVSESGFASETDGYEADGRLRTVYAGLDHQLGDHLLFGASVSRTANQVGYRRADEPSAFQGEADIELSSIMPYARLNAGAFSMWGLYGVGSGDARLTDDLGVETANLSRSLAAAGLRQELASSQGRLGLALKGDVFTTTLSADGAEGIGAEVTAQSRRARVLLESRVDLSGETSTTSFVIEAGGRRDGGDAVVSGNGLEVGSTLSHLNSGTGLGLALEGRYTVMHQYEGFKEWSASGALSLDPGVRGQGLSVSLAPSWGNPRGGAMNWLASDLSGVAAVPTRSGASLSPGAEPSSYEATLKYGWLAENGPERDLRATFTSGRGGVPGFRVGGARSLSERLGLMMSLELTHEMRRYGGPGTAMLLRIHDKVGRVGR